MTTYTDSRGNRHRLTRTQRHYLDRLDAQGRIKSGPGFRSTQTARLLQERGLVAHLMQYGPGDWTMSGLTALGREVLGAGRAHEHHVAGPVGCYHCREMTRADDPHGIKARSDMLRDLTEPHDLSAAEVAIVREARGYVGAGHRLPNDIADDVVALAVRLRVGVHP